jgi:hypothetical protein
MAAVRSGEPQGKLAIRTEIPLDEALKRGHRFFTGQAETSHDLARDVFRDIFGPILGGVERGPGIATAVSRFLN